MFFKPNYSFFLALLFCIHFNLCAQDIIVCGQKTENHDPMIQLFAKTVWSMTLVFYERENDSFSIVGAYRIITSQKEISTYVTRYDDTDGFQIGEHDVKFGYTAEKFRQLGNSDKLFSQIMTQIDPLFFQMTNRGKMLALDKYITHTWREIE